jgi:hypothetical protein
MTSCVFTLYYLHLFSRGPQRTVHHPIPCRHFQHLAYATYQTGSTFIQVMHFHQLSMFLSRKRWVMGSGWVHRFGG